MSQRIAWILRIVSVCLTSPRQSASNTPTATRAWAGHCHEVTQWLNPTEPLFRHLPISRQTSFVKSSPRRVPIPRLRWDR